MAAVLGAVRGVDLIVDIGVGFHHEGDVLVDAAGLDVYRTGFLPDYCGRTTHR